MEHQPKKPKISTVEALLLIIVGVIADLINWIPVVNWVVAAFMFPVTQIYFRLKGVKGVYGLVGNLIELIPFLSVLPAYTFAFAATIYIDRKPESAAAKAVEKAAITKKPLTVKGKVAPKMDALQKTA